MSDRFEAAGFSGRGHRTPPAPEASIPIGDAARLGRELGRRGFCGTERRPENSLLHKEVMYHAQAETAVAVMRRGNAGLEGAAVLDLSRTEIAETAPMVDQDPSALGPQRPGGVPEVTWAQGVTWMYARGIWRPRRYPIGGAREVLAHADRKVAAAQ